MINALVFYSDGGGGGVYGCILCGEKNKTGWVGKWPDCCGLCLKFVFSFGKMVVISES